MHEFHFIRPEFLWLFVPLGLIVSFLVFNRGYNNNWRNACDQHLLPLLLQRVGSVNNYLPLILLITSWLVATIALAGPTWERLPQPVYRSLAAKVIVLDLSNAMYANDLPPSRLSRAKFKVQDLLKDIKDGQVGMVVFTSKPFVVSPLTQDAATIASMVPVLSPQIMPVGGSDIGLALKKAAELIKQGGSRGGQIILMTASPVTAEDDAVAKQLADKGITTSVLGVGTAAGAPVTMSGKFMTNNQGNIVLSKLQPQQLQQLAKAGDGKYVPFTDSNQDLNTLLSTSASSLQFKAEKTSAKTDQWKDQGRYLMLLLLPLALLVFRRGWFEDSIN